MQYVTSNSCNSRNCNDSTSITEGNRFGSLRFGSGLFENSSVRFGSVRTVIFPASKRFDLRFSDASWLGPVGFGSVPCPVPTGYIIKRFASVRFGRFGSVSYSFLSVLRADTDDTEIMIIIMILIMIIMITIVIIIIIMMIILLLLLIIILIIIMILIVVIIILIMIITLIRIIPILITIILIIMIMILQHDNYNNTNISNTGVCKINARYVSSIITSASPPSPRSSKLKGKRRSRLT